MKILSFYLVFCLFTTGLVLAQVDVEIDSTKMDISTAKPTEIKIWFSIWPKLDMTFKGPKPITPLPRIELRDGQTQEILISSSLIKVSNGKKKVDFKISYGKDSKSFLELFRKSDRQVYFFMSDTLEIECNDGSLFMLSPEQMREISSLASLRLTQQQVDEIIDAKGGYLSVFGNRFDAGLREAQNDTIDRASYFDFAFSKTYSGYSYFQVSGLLSSNLDDPVAHVKVTPFAFRKMSKQSLVVDTFLQSSLNGDDMRLGGSFFYSALIPNFIDMTQGYNRLRPKPIINFGVNLSYYSSSAEEMVEKESVAAPFIDLEYYIPVMDKYTVHVQLYAFWRSDAGKVFKFKQNDPQWHWNLAIHYAVPGFSKVIGKYTYGTDAFTQETDNRLMLGLLVDFVE